MELLMMELFLHLMLVREVPGLRNLMYTADATTISHAIGFTFSSSFMLQEVELSIFLCTPWSIPRSGLTINIHRGITFPRFIATSRTVTLQPNCMSLETIYIYTSPTRNGNIYVIEFNNSATVGGIYIGEVIFRDQVTQDRVCKSDRVHNFILFQYCLLYKKNKQYQSAIEWRRHKFIFPLTKILDISYNVRLSVLSTNCSHSKFMFIK